MRLKQTVIMLFLAIFMVADISAQELKFPDLDPSPMDAATYPRRAAFKNYLDDNDPDRTQKIKVLYSCLLYTSPSPRDKRQSRMPSSA